MDDWDRGPWNRWTYQHVAEILPTERVWRGKGHSSPMPEDHQDILSLPFAFEQQQEKLEDFFAGLETDGLLIMHRGKVVVERYYNGMRQNTLHLSQSVGKSVTGAAAGVLIGRGLLDPSAPLSQYLPDLATCAYGDATVRNLLDMTSGVRFSEEYTALDSEMAKLDVACGWKSYGGSDWPRTVWELILGLKDKEREHGALFQYRSIETDVLAFVMQSITGKSLAEIISETVWHPMGAEEDARLTLDPGGYGLASGGFNATLRDYARFAQIYASDGRANGRQVVPSQWVADTRAGRGEDFTADYRHVLPNGAYRNQFWIEEVGKPVLLGRGVFGQMLYIDPEAEFVGVVLSSWPDFVAPDRTRKTIAAMRAMRAML
jgi:CubicO group peptidase (beta-lactamase class C family)